MCSNWTPLYAIYLHVATVSNTDATYSKCSKNFNTFSHSVLK